MGEKQNGSQAPRWEGLTGIPVVSVENQPQRFNLYKRNRLEHFGGQRCLFVNFVVAVNGRRGSARLFQKLLEFIGREQQCDPVF